MQGGLCAGGLCLGVFVKLGLYPGWVTVQGGSLSRGSVSGEGGLCPGESLSGRPLPPWTDPPYSNERTIRVLLECILVKKEF